MILILWLATPPYFLAKIAQILQKVITFFQKREKEMKLWFWHIGTAQWLKFFCANDQFFRFWPSSAGNGKVLTLGQSLFHKNSNPSKTSKSFNNCLCLLEYYLWWEFRQYRTIFGGSRARKPPKKAILWMLNWHAKLFNLTTTNAILMKFTTIMYFHESVNRKALRARNSVFSLKF